MKNSIYVVREAKIVHEDRCNRAEVAYWGSFNSEEAANEYASNITGRLVEVHPINKV